MLDKSSFQTLEQVNKHMNRQMKCCFPSLQCMSYPSFHSRLPFLLQEVEQKFHSVITDLDCNFGKARSTYRFLFQEWMPLGYAGIIPVAEMSIIPATLAMLNYGIAVTLIDDVTDVDVLDRYYGKNFSGHVSICLAQVLIGKTESCYRLGKTEKHFINQVNKRIRAFLQYVESLPYYTTVSPYFVRVNEIFSRHIMVCRDVRTKMEVGEPISASDIHDLMNLIPYGMTVVMAGLLGLAHLPATSLRIKHWKMILKDLETAQLICHYYNAGATLIREIGCGDVFNPIILRAALKKKIDIHQFCRQTKREYLSLLFREQKLLERRNKRLLNEFCTRLSWYENHGLRCYFEKLIFGIKFLDILYKTSIVRI